MCKKRILVVDDEPDMRKLVETRLRGSGYDVISANDGEEGLAKAKQLKPDLILLDIMMPKMEGTAMAETLKQEEITRNIPIIFLTSLVRKEEEKEIANMMGEYFFMAKPFDWQKLLSMIEKVITK